MIQNETQKEAFVATFVDEIEYCNIVSQDIQEEEKIPKTDERGDILVGVTLGLTALAHKERNIVWSVLKIESVKKWKATYITWCEKRSAKVPQDFYEESGKVFDDLILSNTEPQDFFVQVALNTSEGRYVGFGSIVARANSVMNDIADQLDQTDENKVNNQGLGNRMIGTLTVLVALAEYDRSRVFVNVRRPSILYWKELYEENVELSKIDKEVGLEMFDKLYGMSLK